MIETNHHITDRFFCSLTSKLAYLAWNAFYQLWSNGWLQNLIYLCSCHNVAECFFTVLDCNVTGARVGLSPPPWLLSTVNSGGLWKSVMIHRSCTDKCNLSLSLLSHPYHGFSTTHTMHREQYHQKQVALKVPGLFKTLHVFQCCLRKETRGKM